MNDTSRTAKSIINVKVAIIFYFLNLTLQFFSRKVFFDYLGSEVLGLNTTVQNLLGFLNLAELGIGNAIAYNLYKPLYNNDHKTINEIVSVQGWLYRKVVIIISTCSIGLMSFFPLIFAKTHLPLWYSYGSFIVLLFAALISYYFNYTQILFSADQKEYLITYRVQGIRVIKVLLQILAIRFLSEGYLWWMILEFIMAIITAILLDRGIKKEYPWLKTQPQYGKKLKELYPGIITKTKQMFFHKIGGFVLTQTSPIIIYAYASLTLVAIYGNYMLIISGVTMLVNSLLNGVSAGVGNLVAEGDIKRIKTVFWELTSLRMWIGSIVCFGIYALADSFITLWIGEDYILPQSSLIVLIAITFISLTRTYDIFINAYGLFQDVWSPMVEAAINLSLSILLGYKFGLTGILSGVLISQIVIICTWKPFFLYRYGLKEKFISYVMRYLKLIILLCSAFYISENIITSLIKYNIKDFIHWGLYAIIIISLYSLISLIILYLLDTSARLFTKRIIKIITK